MIHKNEIFQFANSLELQDSTIEKDLEKIADTAIRPDDCLVQFNTLPPEVETLKAAKQMGFGIILKVAVTRSGAIPSCSSAIVTAKIIIAHRLMPANISGLGKLALPAKNRVKGVKKDSSRTSG